jgi:hypothetical protein
MHGRTSGASEFPSQFFSNSSSVLSGGFIHIPALASWSPVAGTSFSAEDTGEGAKSGNAACGHAAYKAKV